MKEEVLDVALVLMAVVVILQGVEFVILMISSRVKKSAFPWRKWLISTISLILTFACVLLAYLCGGSIYFFMDNRWLSIAGGFIVYSGIRWLLEKIWK